MDSEETEEVLISMGEGMGSRPCLSSSGLPQKVDTEGVRQGAEGRWVC